MNTIMWYIIKPLAISLIPVPKKNPRRAPMADFEDSISYAVYKGSNRNDLCVAPRVLPVVEAMAAMVVLDFILLTKK